MGADFICDALPRPGVTFLCRQRKVTQRKRPCDAAPCGGCPALLTAGGSCGTRCAQTATAPVSPPSVMFGASQWEGKTRKKPYRALPERGASYLSSPLSRSRAPQGRGQEEREMSERSEFLRDGPGTRSAGQPPQGAASHGRFLLVRFLSRERK